MQTISRNAITLVWLLLIVATGLSWSLGTDHSIGGQGPAATTISIMVIAMLKVRFVILYFMEVRTAPLPLRLICEAWVLVVCAAILGLYLFRQ